MRTTREEKSSRDAANAIAAVEQLYRTNQSIESELRARTNECGCWKQAFEEQKADNDMLRAEAALARHADVGVELEALRRIAHAIGVGIENSPSAIAAAVEDTQRRFAAAVTTRDSFSRMLDQLREEVRVLKSDLRVASARVEEARKALE